MIRPRKMKQVQMIVLKKDINALIEYLGRREIIHFDKNDEDKDSPELIHFMDLYEKIKFIAEYLEIELPSEPNVDSTMPAESDEAMIENIYESCESVKSRETVTLNEKKRIEEAYLEAKTLSNLNITVKEMNQLSYMTLRIGRIDPNVRDDLKQQLGHRAIIISLGDAEDDRIIAVSSRKGRFALDSELKNYSFKEISVPENFDGIPGQLLSGIKKQLDETEIQINEILHEKIKMKDDYSVSVKRLASLLLIGIAVEKIKTQCASTSSAIFLSGWIPSDMIDKINIEILGLTGGRTAIRIYNPNEIPEIQNNIEKIPVALRHGPFLKSFEKIVFSYGAPLYGTIDPTPLVAAFFILLFGIMFGDMGHGFVLLLLGLLTMKRGPKLLKRFQKFSVPLTAVGITSMIMGFLAGSVFTNEDILIPVTRAISTAFTGNPVDRFISIMPLAESGGSITKLFYFFGFTIAIGIIFNLTGMVINIINNIVQKNYEAAFFTKTGLSGILLFGYAVFIAVRIIYGGSFLWFDYIGLFFPVILIFFGPAIWRCFARKKPVLEHGLTTFIMEGFVGILETVSSYVSNSVSFLRVGAFALSHTVLSYIVFRFTEELLHYSQSPVVAISAVFIFIFGNLIIIILEGMIVAIQVMRLQYYEFFSKFFTNTGVEYSPFSFRRRIL